MQQEFNQTISSPVLEGNLQIKSGILSWKETFFRYLNDRIFFSDPDRIVIGYLELKSIRKIYSYEERDFIIEYCSGRHKLRASTKAERDKWVHSIHQLLTAFNHPQDSMCKDVLFQTEVS